MVTELSSGPFLAIEIGSANPDEHAYQSFRQLCGPSDPVIHVCPKIKIVSIHRISLKIFEFFIFQEIAREIRPKTIRACFGVNTIKNAVHCTDLEEDCLLEVEYFFQILSK